MLTDIERLAMLDSRVEDLLDTMRQNAEQGIGWLRASHPGGGKVHRADLATLSMAGFVVGFVVAARLAREDAGSLDELYTLLQGAVSSVAEIDHPDMTAALHRGARHMDA